MDGEKIVLLISIVLGVSLSAMPQSPLPDTVKRSDEFPKIKSAQVRVEARWFIPDSLKTIWFLPHISNKPKIEYPNLAKQKGVQGTVLLILNIDEKGNVIKSRMFRSCGDTMLDRAAKAGVWRSKFAPPRTKKGEGIGTFPYRVMVGVIFRLSYDIPKGWVTGVK